MNDINYTLSVKVTNGPTFTATETLKVEAYDRIDVEIRTGKQVKVRIPPNDKRELQMLIIQRTPLDPKSDAATNLGKLTYQVGNSGCWVVLDSAASHFALGAGFVQLLAQVPAEITFKNDQDQTVTVTIFVARKASTDTTPAPIPPVPPIPPAPGAPPPAAGAPPTLPAPGAPPPQGGTTTTLPGAGAATQGNAPGTQGGTCP